jgi:branched-chain amino acid aminotransferase
LIKNHIFSTDLNENGLQCILFKDALKSVDAYSNLKHNNYLPYLMGALQAKKMKCNDAIIFNANLNICDSTIANVFLIKEK